MMFSIFFTIYKSMIIIEDHLQIETYRLFLKCGSLIITIKEEIFTLNCPMEITIRDMTRC